MWLYIHVIYEPFPTENQVQEFPDEPHWQIRPFIIFQWCSDINEIVQHEIKLFILLNL